MRAIASRFLNDIVSLTVLVLMAVALVAAQTDTSERGLQGNDAAWQATNIRHIGE